MVLASLFWAITAPSVEASTHGMSTTDVSVELFRDNRCFERAGSALWDTEGSCFVNKYDLVQSKAFTVAIIDSAVKGSEVIRLYLWSDDCLTPVSSGATIVTATAGVCSPVLGNLYGVYTVKYRNSLTPCSEGDSSCSTAKTLKISRYVTEQCAGTPDDVKWKSADGVCIKEGVDVEQYNFDPITQMLSYKLWRNSNNCTEEVDPDQVTDSVETEGCLSAVGVSFFYSLLQASTEVSYSLGSSVGAGVFALFWAVLQHIVTN